MLKVSNLCMQYGNRKVLEDISFEIEIGTVVGLLGVNGAGKSTIMNIITGYLRPTSGSVQIGECDMEKKPIVCKRQIGYLPEVPPLYKDMRICEYLEFVAKLKKISNVYENVEQELERFHLSERKYDFIKNLSKGMQQRVGFAAALLGNPPLIILDEPLVGLDPEESKKTREILRSLREDHAIIISSHILSEIEELCNEILVLKDGKLIFDNSTNNLKNRKKKNQYLLTVKGDKNTIEGYLKQCSFIESFSYVRQVEDNVHEFQMQSKEKKDVRDQVFGYLVGKQLSVYGILKQQNTLEEAFIELNRKEER